MKKALSALLALALLLSCSVTAFAAGAPDVAAKQPGMVVLDGSELNDRINGRQRALTIPAQYHNLAQSGV